MYDDGGANMVPRTRPFGRRMVVSSSTAITSPAAGVWSKPARVGSAGNVIEVFVRAAAMPAWLRGPAEDGTEDLLGMKWVTAFPTNRSLGLPAIHATVLLTDALTGQPRAVLDGAPITAERTAAVSGVALREWWPRTLDEPHVVILGAGTVGVNAAYGFSAWGVQTTVLDHDIDQLRFCERVCRGRVTTRLTTETAISQVVQFADVLIGAVHVPGGRAPLLVRRAHVAAMK